MKYSDANPPLQCFMDQSDWMKGAIPNGHPVGILWHDTAAGNPYIKRYVQPDDDAPNRDELLELLGVNYNGNDWNHASRDGGVNAFIGRLADDSVTSVQVGPWTTHAWGCGGDEKGSCNGYIRNSKGKITWVPDFWIQFEICDDSKTREETYYSNGEKKTRSVRDYSLGDPKYFDAVYNEACELTAYFCKKYNIDPLGTVTFNGVIVPTILCHQDSYRLQLGCDHSDVLQWFKVYNYTMDKVRHDVATLLEPEPAEPIKVGDLVSVKPGATWWSGKTVPNWVLEDNWFVSRLDDKRAVIDENEDHTNSIDSPINVNYLVLVKPAENFKQEEKPVESVTPTPLNLYRVGKTVDEIKQQTSSYISLDSAKEECDKKGYGYHVFTVSGELVYSAPAPVMETPTEPSTEPAPDAPVEDETNPTTSNDGGAPSTSDEPITSDPPDVPGEHDSTSVEPTEPTEPTDADVNWFVKMIKAFIEALRRIFTNK